jgi:colanic acid/amylovoran biosynthesis protein
VIASRYHSIASALYSEVPVLGTGWSHKYKYLFDAFDYSEGLMDIDISESELMNKIDLITNETSRTNVKRKLRDNKNKFIMSSKDMFSEVRDMIGIT